MQNKINRLTAILAVLSLLSTPAIGQALQDEREAFEYARVLYADGLFDTAAEEFRRFILNYPTSERVAQARLRLGDAHYNGGDLEAAVDAYRIFVDRHPDHIEVAAALRNRARALERLGQHLRAAAAFSDLYERFRTGEYAVQDLLSAGMNARSGGDPATAEQAFRTIITDHPGTPLIHEAQYNLGLVLIDQGRESEALARFEAIEQSEREPDALLEIGRIALARQDLARAEKTFAELRKRFPRNRSAQESYLLTGRYYEGLAEWERAAGIYDTARGAKLSAEHLQQAILGLARVYRKTGRDALQLYAQFLKVYPESPFLPDARLGLGRSYVDKRQYRQAIDAFKRLQERFPDHEYSVTAHRDIGDVWAALGSPRQALAAYRRHLDASPPPSEAAVTRLKIASVYREQLGWTDLALAELTVLAAHDDPAVAGSAQYDLARTHEAGTAPELAIREYRNFLERFAGRPEAPDAERRIRYLMDHAPSATVDTTLVDLIAADASSGTRLGLARHLLEARHFDAALPHLETVSADTNAEGAVEAAFLLAEALTAIDRRGVALGADDRPNRSRALAIYRRVVESRDARLADDAAFRVIQLEHEPRDTAAARAALLAYQQFAKTHPASDRLLESRLRAGDAHLVLGRHDASQVDLALAAYRDVAKGNPPPDLAEKAGYGVGRCLAIRKDYVSAENALRDFLFDHPDSDLGEEARFQLGLILLERGYLQSAADEFAELLNAPTSVDLERSSRALLAECYFRLEDFDSAIRIDETLLARGAEPSVLKRLGEAYARTENHEQAISVLGTFVRRFPDEAGADTLAFRRAELLAQLGRTSQAIDAFERVSADYAKSPLKPSALASVGRLQFESENYEAALRAVSEQAAAADRSIAELRIVTLLRLDRAKQARKEIKTFRKAFPGATEALARFQVEEARVQLRYGNPKGARKTLEDVIKKHAGTEAAVDAEYYLIEALAKVGKPEEHMTALRAFVKNRNENANWPDANLALAEVYEADDDYVSASRAYLNALNAGLDDARRPTILESLYEAHANLRLYDSAITYARQLVEQYPHHPTAKIARVRIGELFSEKGAYREAIDELRPQLTRLQGDAWSSAQFVIADAYQKLGEYENALREHLKSIYNHQGSVNWLANAFMGRAQCFGALGRNREAIEELEKIRARFPGTSFVQQADQMIKALRLKQ